MATPVCLVANGDLRLSANRMCWPAQEAAERSVISAIRDCGRDVIRGHEFDPEKGHGFIDSQKRGMEVFRTIPPDAPLVVVEAVWQYSHHVLPGLLAHQGPILTVANWSGQWPGLVGMLNLNAGLTKAGRAFTTIWSERFDDDLFNQTVSSWLETGHYKHDESHVRRYEPGNSDAEAQGRKAVEPILQNGAILGVFDEGCMGMYNAIIPDELLFPMRVYKERLSQS